MNWQENGKNPNVYNYATSDGHYFAILPCDEFGNIYVSIFKPKKYVLAEHQVKYDREERKFTAGFKVFPSTLSVDLCQTKAKSDKLTTRRSKIKIRT